MKFYTIIYLLQGYLTKNGIVDLSRVEKIMRGIGEMEDAIFRRRRENDLNYRSREVTTVYVEAITDSTSEISSTIA